MSNKCEGKDLVFVNLANEQPYDIQAKLFISAFWGKGNVDNEAVFQFCNKYYDTDLFLKGLSPVQKKEASTNLDEHGFHVFLERHIKPITVLEARKRLKEADMSFDGKVSFLEFCVWHFKQTTSDFLQNAPRDLRQLDAQNLTPAIKAAQMALAVVMNEIAKIENERTRLETVIENGKGIKALRAKNELQQLLSRDMTEFNKALLTAEAAVRRAGGKATGVKIDPAVLWWMDQELQAMKRYRPQGK